MNESKKGFGFLSARVLAVLAATFGTTLAFKSQAQVPALPAVPNDDNKITVEEYQNKILKPRLVLKLNVADPDNSLLAFHRSHSSHSSHRSHSSHYSGSSSRSYTPSYTPSYTTPAPSYTPVPATTPKPDKTGASSKETNGEAASYDLGDRVLYKGCKGGDVKALQKLMVKLGYRLLITGYFGDQTEKEVKKFQKNHKLTPDGRVSSSTLLMMQNGH